MKPLVPPDEIQCKACGKVDRKPLPTFPQALLLRLLWLMSSHKGDISTLEKRGHFYFGLTPSGRLIVSADSHRENRLASRTDLQTPKTPHQIREAQAKQHVAAHDAGPQVRIIAGPGTGESFTIGE